MVDDVRPGSFLYFASHPDQIDVRELWQKLGQAMGKRVVVVPFPPRAIAYVAMVIVTLLAKIFRFKNQLDEKQYDQTSAPAFVCSSARLRAELAWAPEHNLADTLSNAAKGYRDTGWL